MVAPLSQQSTTIFGIVSDAMIPISHSPTDINGPVLNSSAITVDAISSTPPALFLFGSDDQIYLDPSNRIWAHNQSEIDGEAVVYFELLKLIL